MKIYLIAAQTMLERESSVSAKLPVGTKGWFRIASHPSALLEMQISDDAPGLDVMLPITMDDGSLPGLGFHPDAIAMSGKERAALIRETDRANQQLQSHVRSELARRSGSNWGSNVRIYLLEPVFHESVKVILETHSLTSHHISHLGSKPLLYQMLRVSEKRIYDLQEVARLGDDRSGECAELLLAGLEPSKTGATVEQAMIDATRPGCWRELSSLVRQGFRYHTSVYDAEMYEERAEWIRLMAEELSGVAEEPVKERVIQSAVDCVAKMVAPPPGAHEAYTAVYEAMQQEPGTRRVPAETIRDFLTAPTRVTAPFQGSRYVRVLERGDWRMR